MRRHRRTLDGTGVYFGQRLLARVLGDGVVDELQRLQTHSHSRVKLLRAVVVEEYPGDDHQQHDEEEREDEHLVVDVHQEARQPDADFHHPRAVGVAVPLVVLPELVVRQRLVGLGDQDEVRRRLGVVGVPVGVVAQRHVPVRLLDLLLRCADGDAQEGERVEGLDVLGGVDA
ncbi:fumarylacetoacetate hydrolase [Babesia caballi]|uniref:Fumarylacetoacetate hydrolase n=1 Tax=Babesia caballi TaxID=5871 RepID=A0AAV4LSP4_BABCB|nr:fumarylacetoacetate hydrolase [Babesia caballi]